MSSVSSKNDILAKIRGMGRIFGGDGSSQAANIKQMLAAWKQGDRDALSQLTPLVHGELHRLAQNYLAGERPGHVLKRTALA
jgi:hypothetical protein